MIIKIKQIVSGESTTFTVCIDILTSPYCCSKEMRRDNKATLYFVTGDLSKR